METRQSTRLLRDDQGIYHWVYSLDMFKNFSILRTILKGICFCLLIPFAVILAILIKDGYRVESLGAVVGIFVLIEMAAVAVSFAGYFLVAALYGGTYVAMYTMDHNRIAQYQPSDQAEKNKMIGLFSSAAGAAGGNWGLTVAGLATGGRLVVETAFSEILSLKIVRELSEIRVHSFLTWYTVYVNPEDFNFVADYIEEKCVKARIIRK